MPSQEWDSPFTKGNKEFPDAGSAKSMPFCMYEKDMPSGSCPIDSPIDQLKIKQDVGAGQYPSENTSTSYNKSEWDTPFKNRHELGSTYPHD